MNILQANKYNLLIKEEWENKLSSLIKALEKQRKTIEDQGEKQTRALEKHGKQLIMF